ncbi:hypothetical protein HMI54_007803 [Coelomomyces lativittatus]|nr:hypothetical protein HMI54_007803 [Coelomomyces lativittatus]KAJ1508676.1 hypothetical protein HMI56_007172 [Coelomomyces lativittatus]KAJ1517981.1 hypothetical protein HMI55_004257 [Coelomomyces lativittatus]
MPKLSDNHSNMSTVSEKDRSKSVSKRSSSRKEPRFSLEKAKRMIHSFEKKFASKRVKLVKLPVRSQSLPNYKLRRFQPKLFPIREEEVSF